MSTPDAIVTPDRAGSPAEVRARFRAGLRTTTSGMAPGFVQANLIAVPSEHAYDVLLYATRNPKACPLLDVTEPGSAQTVLGDVDLRTDLPGYRIYENGALAGEVGDASDVWRDDLVCFLIGCSFTFETALVRAGVPVRHIDSGRNVPMYRTDIATRAAGRMSGPMVVSMRAIPAGLVGRAVEVTAQFPTMHGTPVHIGDPTAIGIEALDVPDYGDAPIVEDGDVPVFWACGVTPQAAVEQAAFPFALAHVPGQMLVTDLPEPGGYHA